MPSWLALPRNLHAAYLPAVAGSCRQLPAAAGRLPEICGRLPEICGRLPDAACRAACLACRAEGGYRL